MNEPIEHIEMPEDLVLSDKDQADLDKLLAEQPPIEYHTVLKVWHEILKPENRETAKDITMQWANGIVAQYAGVGFGDMPAYRDAYFALFDDMYAILEYEIDSDEECLNHSDVAEDREHNGHHYLNLLTQWQLAFLRKELEWDCTASTAAIDIAALSEVHKVFFGQTGLTGHLEAIQFEFTEADQQDLADSLAELRENFNRVEGR